MACRYASRAHHHHMDKTTVLNKAHLVESIVRHRIQDSLFYKQHLYLTNELTILDTIVAQVHYIGGTDAGGRPSPFLCCLLRLLELEPLPEILELYLLQNGFNRFKYLTALALLYCRLVLKPPAFYTVHDQYIRDYRKLRMHLKLPVITNTAPVHYKLIHMDEWVDLLAEDGRVVDLIMPYMAPRQSYVEKGEAQPREYGVTDELEDLSDYVSDSD